MIHMPKPGRPSTAVFWGLGLLAGVLALQLLQALAGGGAQQARLAATADLVARLGLSDIALFTEARYTRHPALADLATAFQDSPTAFEHFPSGSFVAPPRAFGATALSLDAKDLPQ